MEKETLAKQIRKTLAERLNYMTELKTVLIVSVRKPRTMEEMVEIIGLLKGIDDYDPAKAVAEFNNTEMLLTIKN